MDYRQLVRMLAAGRVAIGVALMAMPGLTARVWAGQESARPVTKVFLRAVGVRDLVLGLGTLRALERGDDVASWARYGAAADGVDAAATLIGYRSLAPRGRLAVLALAGSAAAGGAVAAENLQGE